MRLVHDLDVKGKIANVQLIHCGNCGHEERPVSELPCARCFWFGEWVETLSTIQSGLAVALTV